MQGKVTGGSGALTGDAALLDVQQTAALLRCSPRHVYRLADAGKMPPPVRLGVLIRWQHDAIKRWIAEGCPSCRGKAVRP